MHARRERTPLLLIAMLAAMAGDAARASAQSVPPGAPSNAVRAARVTGGTLAFEANATTGPFEGTTTTVQGEVRPAPPPAIATGWVSFAARTLKTGRGMRDRHMLGSLEAEAHPEIRLAVERVTPTATAGDTTRATVTGTLTIKGISRPVEVPAVVVRNPTGYALTARFPIDLRDWKVSGLSRLLGAVKMDPAVTIRVELAFGFEGGG
ncbi:MAG TPA: YceI family protein [Gemmatimonadaceae bacterium]|nr:YceI family protein [Gemmatimonadaceae bacterium]